MISKEAAVSLDHSSSTTTTFPLLETCPCNLVNLVFLRLVRNQSLEENLKVLCPGGRRWKHWAVSYKAGNLGGKRELSQPVSGVCVKVGGRGARTGDLPSQDIGEDRHWNLKWKNQDIELCFLHVCKCMNAEFQYDVFIHVCNILWSSTITLLTPHLTSPFLANSSLSYIHMIVLCI